MRVRVEVEYIPQTATIDYPTTIATFPAGNNQSNLAHLDIPSFTGANVFLYGSSKFGGGQVYLSEYKGWVGLVSADTTPTPEGDYEFPVGQEPTFTVFTLGSPNVRSFSIYFDAVVSQWATLIEIDGTNYTNNGFRFTVANLADTSAHTVKILRWNTAGMPARITSLLTGLVISYEDEIISAVRGSQMIKDNSQLEYGVISQYGSLRLRDIDGEIRALAQSRVLRASTPVRIYFIDDLNTEHLIGSYITEKWHYPRGGAEVKADLVDNLLVWQALFIPAKRELIIPPSVTTGDTIYNHMKDMDDSFNYMPTTEVQMQFANTRVAYWWYEAGMIWEQWEKICQLKQLRIWRDIQTENVVKLSVYE